MWFSGGGCHEHSGPCVEKRGGTTGVLNRRAGDRRERREIDARLRMSREAQGLSLSTQKTRMDTKTVKTRTYIYVLTNKEHESVTTEQVGEQMPMPARQRKRGKQDGGDAGSTRAFFRAARASPKPAQRKLWSYGERERSVRIRSDNTSSSLRAIPSLSTSPSFYSFKKGAVSLINYPPNKPILLGSSLYLIPSYLHRRSRTREGPVRTRLCTDCARGRFSSRQRVCMGTHPY